MDSETQIIEAPKTGLIAQHGNNVEVTASTPDEMAVANSALIVWCEKKINEVKASAAELRAAYDTAVKRKWGAATLKRHAALEEKRITFYEKILTALKAGFMIVPNFPVTAFAIRTDREKPLRMLTHSTWKHHPGDMEQQPAMLPAGEGEYQNPFPHVANTDWTRPEDKQKRIECYASAWNDLQFPITMAKAHIIEATNRVMALKLFDDLGILPAANVKRDPMIIARIKDPRSTKYNQRFVSFMVAWHLDTEVL